MAYLNSNQIKLKQKHTTVQKIVYCRHLLLMLLPALIYFAIFSYGPMYGLQIAFKDFRLGKGIIGSEWVGITNFTRLFSNSMFHTAVINTLILSLYRMVFVFPVPIILSLMLNEIRFLAFKRMTQTIIYLPHFISAVIAASLVTMFLSPEYGLINDAVRLFGGESIYFLIEARYFRTILTVTNIWRGAGWGTIVYLAALASVDSEIVEAAIIDGASRLQRIRYINIPSIMGVVVIMFILAVGSILNSDFETILNLYNPLVYEVGDVIDTYIYRIGLQSEGRNMYSVSTAAGLFKSIIGFTMIIMTNKLASHVSEGEMKIW